MLSFLNFNGGVISNNGLCCVRAGQGRPPEDFIHPLGKLNLDKALISSFQVLLLIMLLERIHGLHLLNRKLHD